MGWLVATVIKLGLGASSLLKFLIKNWKIVLPAILLVVGFFVHQRAVHDFGEKKFQEGRDDFIGKIRITFDEIDRQNREKEEEVAGELTDMVERTKETDKKRIKVEERAETKAKEAIDPDFKDLKVSDDYINQRNIIRAQGPKVK